MKKSSMQNGKATKAPEKKSNPSGKIFKTLGRLLLTLFLVCVISGCIIVGVIVVYVLNADSGDSIDLSSVKLNYTSVIYATNSETGKNVEVQRLSGDENRIWVDLSKIPDNLQNAFICTEDQHFYEHNGVDYKRTAFSFFNMIFKFRSSQGGSTITQQLVKNIDDIKTARIPGKIKQIVLALDLEKRYSKKQILEAYLNTINLGGTLCGVQTAANTYFGKDVSQLDIAQCACLAAIVKSPAKYNPLTNPENNKERRNSVVLKNMLSQGAITQAEYDKAVAEKLTFSSKTTAGETSNVYSYFVDQVINDVTSDLMTQKGYTKDYARHIIYSGGLQIYTTMDPFVQSTMESVYEKSSSFPKYSGKTQPQSAMIIVNYTGGIVGIVGGRGKKTANLVLDRATQSKRQPGSSLKPLAVYGPAVERNIVTYSTMIQDKSLTLSGGTVWPRDANGTTGSGKKVTVTVGLAKSLNTVSARILQMMDFSGRTSFNFLTQKVGFTSLVESRTSNGKTVSDVGYWLATGSLTDGVTLREMAGGYEIFGNGGKYYGTYTYTKVLDSNNNVILENDPTPIQAISEDTACVMNKLLQQNVLTSYGTARSAKLGSMPSAGKTGTTSDYKDRWFCGLTPYYVGVAWFGYDSPKAMYNTSNPCISVWRTVMKKISAKQKVKDFPTSGSVVKKVYCLESGMIATDACPKTGVGWYRVSNVPGVCTLHPEGWTSLSSVISSSLSSVISSVPGNSTSSVPETSSSSQVSQGSSDSPGGNQKPKSDSTASSSLQQ